MCLTQTGKQCSRKSLIGRRFCKQHDQGLMHEKKSVKREEVKIINKLPKIKFHVPEINDVPKEAAPKSAMRKHGSPSRGSIKFNANENVVVFKRGVNKPGLVVIEETKSPTRS